MKYRTRTFYSETQKAMMWDRWRQGETLHTIAQLFDRHHNSVPGILAQTGGIRPAQRVRSKRVLSLSEREEISRGVVARRSIRAIAASIGSRSINCRSRDQAQWGLQRLPGMRSGPSRLGPSSPSQAL
jgi:hypothetical protein